MFAELIASSFYGAQVERKKKSFIFVAFASSANCQHMANWKKSVRKIVQQNWLFTFLLVTNVTRIECCCYGSRVRKAGENVLGISRPGIVQMVDGGGNKCYFGGWKLKLETLIMSHRQFSLNSLNFMWKFLHINREEIFIFVPNVRENFPLVDVDLSSSSVDKRRCGGKQVEIMLQSQFWWRKLIGNW